MKNLRAVAGSENWYDRELRGEAVTARHLAVARATCDASGADEGARLEIALAVSDGVLQILIIVTKPTT